MVDLAKNAVAGEITDTPGVHGFVVAPELQRGFSTNGKEAKVSVVDLKTLSTISKVDSGENPDALVYDARRGEVYVFNHKGNSATVIDAKSANVVSTIALGGSPEFAAVDSAAGRVYCNLEDKNEVVVIDTAKHEVTARWPVAPGEEPSGIAFDAAHHRLFAGCHNKMMAMLDTETGKVVATVPIGAGRRWLCVRRCDAARVRVLWRWHDHDRERGNTAEAHGRSDAQDRTSCANDGARSRHASDLFALRAIPATAAGVARCFSRAADDCAEYSKVVGLRPAESPAP